MDHQRDCTLPKASKFSLTTLAGCIAYIVAVFPPAPAALGGLTFGAPTRVTSLNTSFAELARGISGDGLTIYMSSSRPTPPSTTPAQDLWMSKRTSTSADWEAPTPITELNTAFNEFNPFVTPDDLSLIYDGENGNLWISHRASTSHPWSPAEELPAPINSPQADGGSFLTADRLTLLFNSNRPGTLGADDLWMATRPSLAEEWTVENLGSVVNSAAQERTPYLSADGRHLFFGSTRPGGVGDYDLYVSSRALPTDPWGAPENLGPQINTPLNDNVPLYWDAGKTLFFRSHGLASPQGQADIFQVRVIAEPSTGLLAFGGVALVGGYISRRRRRVGQCAAALIAPVVLLGGVDRASAGPFQFSHRITLPSATEASTVTAIGDKVAVKRSNQVDLIDPASGTVLYTLRPASVDPRFASSIRTAGSLLMISSSVFQANYTEPQALYFFDPATGVLQNKFEFQSSFESVAYLVDRAVVIGQEVIVPSLTRTTTSAFQEESYSVVDISTGAVKRSFFNRTLDNPSFSHGGSIVATDRGWLMGDPYKRSPGTITYAGYAFLHDPRTGAVLQTLTAPPADPADTAFGAAVLSDGDDVFISSLSPGKVFRYSEPNLTYQQTYVSPPGDPFSFFGGDLAVTDELLLVSHNLYGDDNAGAVHVFDRDSGALLQTLFDPFPNNGDGFGAGIAMAGDLLVVAPNRGGDLLVFSQVPEPHSLLLAIVGATFTALHRRKSARR